MSWWQSVALALLQGLTEFLPISSSGHLVLLPVFAGWQDQGLAFDVAVHFGTLAAVLIYFRDDILAMAAGWFRQLAGRGASAESRLAWAVIVGTLPLGLVGFLGHDWIEGNLRSALVIAGTTGGFGILLWLADRYGAHRRDEDSLRPADALLIGCAQVLALIPGTSRSGITMTAAMALGLTRSAAARFSFLLSIPAILAATGLETWNLSRTAESVDWGMLAGAMLVSAVTAWLAIRLFLTFIERMGMWPFALYRVVLSLVILWFVI
ncbi:MAG: undecaprenyl-diphosphate phosphatase [Gammaproteobacteria bacterium]